MAGIIGLVAAMPGVHWVMYFGGGGHGTITPAYILFGPVMLAWYQYASSEPPTQAEEVWLVVAMHGLYALYAAAIAVGRRLSIGKQVVLAVLALHYTLVLVLASLHPYLSKYGEFTKLLALAPFPQSFGLIEYYVLLHVAAVTFAVSRWPVAKEGFKRTCIWVAIVTLVSFVYVAWAIAPSTH
jgi:hypothetical protein